MEMYIEPPAQGKVRKGLNPDAESGACICYILNWRGSLQKRD